MAVKTAYISKLGKDYQISTHFRLSEMRCKDGSDKVLYSTELLNKLEELRSYGGFTITINSGYRTAAWNKKYNGATKSQHLYGTAADVTVKKDDKAVSGKLICCLAQTLGFKGIGYMSETSVHLDMRASGTYRGNENASSKRDYSNNVGNDFYRYFGVTTSQIATLKKVTEVNTITKNNTEDEEMKYYEKIKDVPSYYRPSIQKLIDKGYLKGVGKDVLNVSEDFCRIITINDRAGLYD